MSTLNAEMIYGDGEDRALVEELLVALADRIRQAPVATSERRSECFVRADPLDRRIRRSIEYMHSRIGERLGLEIPRALGGAVPAALLRSLPPQHRPDPERVLEHAAHGAGGGRARLGIPPHP